LLNQKLSKSKTGKIKNLQNQNPAKSKLCKNQKTCKIKNLQKSKNVQNQKPANPIFFNLFKLTQG
jgi:hypothetical protein